MDQRSVIILTSVDAMRYKSSKRKGDFLFNFEEPMPDANYEVTINAGVERKKRKLK